MTPPAGPPSDEALVARMQRGNRAAYEALMKRHERLVARAVCDVVRDLTAVEDLMQDVFMKVYQKMHLYCPDKGRFPVWLATVARHEAINYLRRLKRTGHLSLDETAGKNQFAPIDRPSEQVSKREVWTRVVEAIDRLREPARTVLRRRMIEGRPFDEIAKLLKRPLDTVKTIYYRNTEALKKRLGLPL